MRLQEKFKKWTAKNLAMELKEEKVLTHDLGKDLFRIGAFSSSRKFRASRIFQAVNDRVENVIYGYEYGCYVDSQWQQGLSKPFYRAILWNLDQGRCFDGILETLRNRVLVSGADIYFFPGVDIGMARSGNQNIVRNLAMELGYNYFFATSFLNIPSPTDKENQLGIEGNAIMTRFPLSNLRIVPLKNTHDPLKFPHKRLGCEKALLADIVTGKGKIAVVCVNLLLHSSQWQRYQHIKSVVKRLKEENRDLPVMIGGDFKATTYNGYTPFYFFLSVINKLFRGYDYIMTEHHSYPEKYFEKRMFDYLIKSGFNFAPFNELGKTCFNLSVSDFVNLFPVFKKGAHWLGKMMAKHSDPIQLKSDWFVANDGIQVSELHQSERPKIISFLYHDGRSVSSHDPLLLDFTVRVRN